jgi:hypothetical protein
MLIFDVIHQRLPKLSEYFRIAERLPALTQLSVPQRVIAACAGLIVLLLQLYDFMDKGIHGITWILSLALVACLFIAAIHGIERMPKADNGSGIGEM